MATVPGMVGSVRAACRGYPVVRDEIHHGSHVCACDARFCVHDGTSWEDPLMGCAPTSRQSTCQLAWGQTGSADGCGLGATRSAGCRACVLDDQAHVQAGRKVQKEGHRRQVYGHMAVPRAVRPLRRGGREGLAGCRGPSPAFCAPPAARPWPHGRRLGAAHLPAGGGSESPRRPPGSAARKPGAGRSVAPPSLAAPARLPAPARWGNVYIAAPLGARQ